MTSTFCIFQVFKENQRSSISMATLSENAPTFQTMRIEIMQADNLNMVFDLIGLEASFVNAFRRVLLAEVSVLYDSSGSKN